MIKFNAPLPSRDITYEGINFKEVENLHNSWLLEIAEAVKNKKEEKLIDSERELITIDIWYMLLWYANKKIWAEDKSLFATLTINDSSIQAPVYYWYFEYNNKYYIILHAEKKIIWEDNQYLYKGIITNPALYLEYQSTNTLPHDTRQAYSELLISNSWSIQDLLASNQNIEKKKYSSQINTIISCIKEALGFDYSPDNRFMLRIESFMQNPNSVDTKNDITSYFIINRKEYLNEIRQKLSTDGLIEKSQQDEEIKKRFKHLFDLFLEKIQ